MSNILDGWSTTYQIFEYFWKFLEKIPLAVAYHFCDFLNFASLIHMNYFIQLR